MDTKDLIILGGAGLGIYLALRKKDAGASAQAYARTGAASSLAASFQPMQAMQTAPAAMSPVLSAAARMQSAIAAVVPQGPPSSIPAPPPTEARRQSASIVNGLKELTSGSLNTGARVAIAGLPGGSTALAVNDALGNPLGKLSSGATSTAYNAGSKVVSSLKFW